MEIRHIGKTGKGGRVIVARLKPGSDLLMSLKGLAQNEGIGASVILSGVRLLRKARLGNCKSFPRSI